MDSLVMDMAGSNMNSLVVDMKGSYMDLENCNDFRRPLEKCGELTIETKNISFCNGYNWLTVFPKSTKSGFNIL
jgi:hypothetical protein